MGRKFPEAELCRIATQHLESEGWRVVAEVAQLSRNIDMVAEKDDQLLCIEAKTSLTRKLRYQVGYLQGQNFSVALVGTTPRESGIQWLKDWGVGLWTVRDGRIHVLLEPVESDRIMPYYRDRLKRAVDKYADMPADAGMPCQKGVGPGLYVQEMVDSYKAAHPKATWRELFENVPNHYNSPQSMASALRSNAERRAWQARNT